MTDISLRCREIFELKGYARIDFRVDQQNKPYVLEVNINPCLSPDAGFPAACQKAGMTYSEMIERIIHDAFL
jgi:D-alanine-D-alanine ligase